MVSVAEGSVLTSQCISRTLPSFCTNDIFTSNPGADASLVNVNVLFFPTGAIVVGSKVVVVVNGVVDEDDVVTDVVDAVDAVDTVDVVDSVDVVDVVDSVDVVDKSVDASVDVVDASVVEVLIDD